MGGCEREQSFIETGKKTGLVHVYTGDGKGKTTAAIGLAVRAAGAGLKVLFVQFFKLEEDPSGEKYVFRNNIASIELIRSKVRHPCFTGPSTDIEVVKKSTAEMFELSARRALTEGFDMVVFDELIGAVSTGLIELEKVVQFLRARSGKNLEVVLTGRGAPVELVKEADYVTEMLKIKHPYGDKGIKARKGIEF